MALEKRDRWYFGRNFNKFRQLFIIFGTNHPDNPCDWTIVKCPIDTCTTLHNDDVIVTLLKNAVLRDSTLLRPSRRGYAISAKLHFSITSQLRHHYVVSCKYRWDILQFFSHTDCQDDSCQKLWKVVWICRRDRQYFRHNFDKFKYCNFFARNIVTTWRMRNY